MKKEYISISVEKSIYDQIKSKYNWETLNKALKILLIQAGEYEPIEEDGDKYREIHESLKHYLNCRLKNMMEQIEERLTKIEEKI